MKNKKLNKEEILWKVNYKILNVYLDYYRSEGYWLTTNKSWDLSRWNILGNVMISKKALQMFLENINLQKASKAKDYGGRAGSRCFVAEHVVPFSIVKEQYLQKFKDKNPTYDQYRKFFLHFNRICYVWHKEDEHLKNIGLNHSVPNINNLEKEIFERYEAANIHPIQTKHLQGNELFKHLKYYRSEGYNFEKVIRLIT